MWLPFALQPPVPVPVHGSHTVRLVNERVWPQLFLVANAVSLILTPLLFAQTAQLSRSGMSWVGLVGIAALFLIANLLILGLRLAVGGKRLTVDFDRAEIGLGSKRFAAADCTSLVSEARSFLGNEHTLRFVFRSGNIDVPTGGLAPSEDILRRNELLGAFIRQCLTVPEHAVVDQGSNARVSRYAIGASEALVQLSR